MQQMQQLQQMQEMQRLQQLQYHQLQQIQQMQQIQYQQTHTPPTFQGRILQYKDYSADQGADDSTHSQKDMMKYQEQPSFTQLNSVGHVSTPNNSEPHLTKRARRRIQMQTKFSKLNQQFVADKDVHYRDALIQLQYKLSTLQSGENPEHLERIRDLEEWRDCELIRLRLAEEYQVEFLNKSFKQEYDETVANTTEIVDMVKKKLQESLINKIKQLKEDKALIDIVTSSKSTGVGPSSRSRNNLISDNGFDSSVNSLFNNGEFTDGDGTNNGNTSGFDTNNSNFFFAGERRSRRKRNHDNGLLHESNVSNSNDDSYDSGTAATNSSRKRAKTGGNNGFSSNESAPKIVTESSVLNEFLYGSNFASRKEKLNSKYTSKSTPQCPSLKPEEINEDLMLLRSFR
ncbi:hypothetical protein CANINC_003274 [Pichia inconspicua]|uniref:Uncharacterized protein n=1 Tax=Pichia inconspicua TaxID=52247 RepID=A0A4T0WYV6_9ASCO|nr:hypothetical protein CANINC_003274 [[Candida] inconspicua]